jgi:ribosomal protein S18 acetylase RimI-like enzyme
LGGKVLKIAVETLVDIKDECQELIEAHWREIAVWQDIPLDPDWGVYQHVETAGMLVIYTVRNETNQLVGYAVFFMRKHLHYKGHGWAANDILWVHPDYRDGKIGTNLVQFWEQDLQARGIHVVHVNVNVAHPALGLVLRREKYKTIESGLEKRLN